MKNNFKYIKQELSNFSDKENMRGGVRNFVSFRNPRRKQPVQSWKMIWVEPQDPLDKALFQAIKADSYDGVRKAIREGANRDVCSPYINTETGGLFNSEVYPIIVASSFGKIHAVEALIDCGVDVNAKRGWGESPLLVAACNGYFDVVKVLIAAGADPDMDYRGVSVCDWCLDDGHVKIARYLQKLGAHHDPTLRSSYL